MGNSVSVIGIKAVGTVTRNMGDGQTVQVEWSNTGLLREWYYFTNRATVWRVEPGEWRADALLAFTFDGEPQDVERFRAAARAKKR